MFVVMRKLIFLTPLICQISFASEVMFDFVDRDNSKFCMRVIVPEDIPMSPGIHESVHPFTSGRARCRDIERGNFTYIGQDSHGFVFKEAEITNSVARSALGVAANGEIVMHFGAKANVIPTHLTILECGGYTVSRDYFITWSADKKSARLEESSSMTDPCGWDDRVFPSKTSFFVAKPPKPK